MKFETDPNPDLRFVLMRFGDLTIDPRRCPLGIRAFGHWHQVDGAAFAACACTKDASSPDSESGEAHNEASRSLLASSAAS